MSFSPDIRASRNFQRQFGKEKRRLQLSEVPQDDIDTLQEHVVDIRTQIAFSDVADNQANIHDVPNGPNDYIFEPDYDTVKLRTLFRDVFGVGEYANHTFNISSTLYSYNGLRLYDQAAVPGQKLWFYIPIENPFLFSKAWKWNVDVNPPNLEHANSLFLNAGDDERQFLRVDDSFDNSYNFSSTDFSIGFWFRPNAVLSSISPDVLAYRFISSTSKWSIEIDLDGKLFAIVKKSGTDYKRQFDTVLSIGTWYFVCMTWNSSTNTIVLKVNDASDTSSTKTTGTTDTINGLFFGSYPGADSSHDFQGSFTGLTYYNATILSTAEMSRLYNYNTKHDTTEPLTYGYGQYG